MMSNKPPQLILDVIWLDRLTISLRDPGSTYGRGHGEWSWWEIIELQRCETWKHTQAQPQNGKSGQPFDWHSQLEDHHTCTNSLLLHLWRCPKKEISHFSLPSPPFWPQKSRQQILGEWKWGRDNPQEALRHWNGAESTSYGYIWWRGIFVFRSVASWRTASDQKQQSIRHEVHTAH